MVGIPSNDRICLGCGVPGIFPGPQQEPNGAADADGHHRRCRQDKAQDRPDFSAGLPRHRAADCLEVCLWIVRRNRSRRYNWVSVH